VLVGATVLGLTAACGDDGDTTATASQPAAPASAAPASAAPTSAAPAGGGAYGGAPGASAPAGGTTTSAAGAATSVTVTATEFSLKLSQQTFTPGTYTFVTKNDGGVVHALEIQGPGLTKPSTADLGPGQAENLTVTLQRGTYKLICPVGNHAGQGMTLDITVA
jgi:uncharacterized cupredoxin-like copper-binding protein